MREKIIEILAEINDDIMKDTEVDLLISGILDSFEIINLVVDLEENFNIEIDPEQVVPENFRTVDAITKLVKSIR